VQTTVGGIGDQVVEAPGRPDERRHALRLAFTEVDVGEIIPAHNCHVTCRHRPVDDQEDPHPILPRPQQIHGVSLEIHKVLTEEDVRPVLVDSPSPVGIGGG